MTLTINGESREVGDALSVAELLVEIDLAGRPVAVEVNKEVVPKARHAQHRLAEGDVLEIVTFVGGG